MFQKVEYPIAQPGSCYFCGSGTKSPFIDWGVSIEFYGALYTCAECTGAVASLLGMITQEKHNDVLAELDKLGAENLVLSIQNTALREAIESINVANFGNEGMMVVHESLPNFTPELGGTVADLDSDILVDSESGDEATRDSTEFLDFGTRASDESSDDERVDKLHSNEPGPDYRLSI